MSLDFEALFRDAPNAYMVLDRDLRYVAVNDAYLKITLSHREDLVGRGVFEAFPDGEDQNDGSRLLADSFRRVFETGKRDTIAVIKYTMPVETPDGIRQEDRFWSATHTPITSADGRVEYLLQNTIDVTELQALRSERDHRANTAAASVMRNAQRVEAANRSLHLERSHMQRMFDQAPVFVCFLRGRDHVYEMANPAYYGVIGHREIIGKTVREALPEIVEQGFLELLDDVYATGVPYVGKGASVQFQKGPGAPFEERFVDFTYQPIVEPDGTISGIFTIGTDITEARAATIDRERLATLVEQSSDFIASVNMDGRITFMNEAGHVMLGTGGRELASLDPLSFFPEEHRPFLFETIVPAIEAHGRWRGDFFMRRVDDGRIVPVDYNVFKLLDHDGIQVGLASVTRDLSVAQRLEAERRSALEAERDALTLAAEAAREQRFLAHSIPAQVWTADPSGRLTYVNRHAIDYFGVQEDVLLANGWTSVLHADDVDDTVTLWTSSLETGADYETQFRLRRADGAYRWHIARATALRDDAGRVTKWYGTNLDVDDQRRTLDERDALIAALEQSNRELDSFAYVASHDLKAPLRGMNNVATWLEEDLASVLTDQSREHLAMMRRRVTHMSSLIDGVLRYARAGRTTEALQTVDVHDLIEGVVELVSAPARVHVRIGNGMPTLSTSYTALQQVFLNLIGNAAKHAATADAQIDVRVRDDGERWEFAVRDNGPGIAREHQARIWGLFQTAAKEHEAIDNSGIGLSIVRKIVEGRRGKAWVESDVGRGATFSFTWPKHE